MNPDFSIIVNSDYSFSNSEIKIGNNKKEITIQQINEIKRLLNLPTIKAKKEYFQKLLLSLNENNQQILNFILSKGNKKLYLEYLKNSINESQIYLTNYFSDILPIRNEFIDRIITLPDCIKTVYDHNTVTGRLKVIAGTNFLTMKEENRKLLKHPDTKRSMYEIDFKSCEPNFYIKSNSIPVNELDIYNFIMEKFKLNTSRDKFKRGLLSLMYGANNKTISVISGIKQNKIKSIKDFLKIDEFKSNLEEEYEKTGFVKNFYGRPLLSNNNLVNHWIQSSSADYCCLAFNNFLKNNSDIQLHGIIHDAIIISVTKEINLKSIKDIVSNIEIPISIKKL